MVSDNTGVPEGLPEPPGEVMGLIEPEGIDRAAAQEVARPPSWGVRIGLGGGGALSLSLSLSFLPSPSFLVGLGKGVLLLLGGGLPLSPWRA